MEQAFVTTPYGRRPMTLAQVRRQVATNNIAEGHKADKWKIFRDASDARLLLGLQDRSLAVLHALLSFYPAHELSSDGAMVVFPSNVQLSNRAHGIAGATLRRHLALLVDVGLILRRDSANGKRYARKDFSGKMLDAFGFDLSPLLLRAAEISDLAKRVAAERLMHRQAREDYTIFRRDVRKLISLVQQDDFSRDWVAIENAYREIVDQVPRAPSITELAHAVRSLEALRSQIVNSMNLNEKTDPLGTDDAQGEHHIQSQNPESFFESEVAVSQVENHKAETTVVNQPAVHTSNTAPSISLVNRACPDAKSYAPGGAIQSWRDLHLAALTIHTMLGVSPSAFRDACDAMGRDGASAVMAYIVQRAEQINSAGGYLRDLTARAKRGELRLEAMLVGQVRAGGAP